MFDQMCPSLLSLCIYAVFLSLSFLVFVPRATHEEALEKRDVYIESISFIHFRVYAAKQIRAIDRYHMPLMYLCDSNLSISSPSSSLPTN